MTSEQIGHAAKILHRGGIIAYPTESCFGIGCDPRNTGAIKRILALKRRSHTKGLILIADRFSRFTGFLELLPRHYLEKMFNTWPGPVTWLCPARSNTSKWLTGKYQTLGVRVTGHPFAAQICCRARMAIVSTSANRVYRPPLRNAKAVRREFDNKIDFIVDLPVGSRSGPSLISDVITDEVIRI